MTSLKIVDRKVDSVPSRSCAGAGREVKRVMGPGTVCSELDPFILLEEFSGRDDEAAIPAAPYRGFIRLSYLISGGMSWAAMHPELGEMSQTAAEGDVVALVSGRGATFRSEGASRTGGPLRGSRYRELELWVRTPRESLAENPRCDTYRAQELPKVKSRGWEAVVLLGSFDGRTSGLLSAPTPARVICFTLNQGASVRYDVPEGWSTSCYVVDGQVEFQGNMQQHGPSSLVVLGMRHGAIDAQSSQDRPACFVLMTGKPLMMAGCALTGTIAGSSAADVERARGRFGDVVGKLERMAAAFAEAAGPAVGSPPPAAASGTLRGGYSGSTTPRPSEAVAQYTTSGGGGGGGSSAALPQLTRKSTMPVGEGGQPDPDDLADLRERFRAYDTEMKEFLGKWKAHLEELNARIHRDPANVSLRQQYQEKLAKYQDHRREYMQKWDEYREATGQPALAQPSYDTHRTQRSAAAPSSGFASVREAIPSPTHRTRASRASSPRSVESAAPGPRCSSPIDEELMADWTRVKVLGKGAYGTVWAGMLSSGETVAVKEIVLDDGCADEDRAAFEAEFQLMQQLRHPNIVRYLGHMFDGPSRLTIFLEYVTGGSVGGVVRSVKKHGSARLPGVVARRYVNQVLLGLEYLHDDLPEKQVVVHRDIKGDNLLLSTDGHVKLADFGTAKMLEQVGRQTAAFDHAKTMVGTPLWMAPEVISPDERGYDSKCDIWSLGCVIIEMYGNTPWGDHAGQSPWEIMYTIAKATGGPTNVPADVPPVLRSFLEEGCFRREPAQRKSARELLQHRYITCPDAEISGHDGSRSPRPGAVY